MTDELTSRQRGFVVAYCANGGNGTQAAIEAGYAESGAHVEANRLLSNVKISNAIATFRAQTAERAQVTIESLTQKLEEIVDSARETQPGAAVSALNTIAKLHGLLAEDRKNERSPLNEVLNRINRQNNGKPRLTAVK